MRIATKTAFIETHPTVLALYCSDGRYTRAVEELAETLGHPRIDVLCVPGGAGAMDAWTSGSVILAGHLRSQAEFLIAAHHITDVLLISHESCGFYKAQHAQIDDHGRRLRQVQDLARAAALLMHGRPHLNVRTFHARNDGARIVFDPGDRVSAAASSPAPHPTTAR